MKPSELLCVSDMDGTLLSPGGRLSVRAEHTVNALIARGVPFSIATARTPATLVELVKNLHLRLPVACMNGAALYDLTARRFLSCHEIPAAQVQQIYRVVRRHKRNIFVQMVADDGTLDIFHEQFTHPAEQHFHDLREPLPLKRYILAPPPPDRNAVYLSLLDRKPVVDALLEQLRDIPGVTATSYRDVYYQGYYFLELYNQNASKAAALQDLRRLCGARYTLAFGDNDNDIPMLKQADEGMAVSNATAACKQAASRIIGSNAEDAVAAALEEILGRLEG